MMRFSYLLSSNANTVIILKAKRGLQTIPDRAQRYYFVDERRISGGDDQAARAHQELCRVLALLCPPTCRALHFVGSTLGLVCLLATFITGQLWLLLLGLALGYGFAWTGHFFVEYNWPATFQYPLWSFRADGKMWWLTLVRRMQPEVERARRTASRGGC